jgi:hypothetical protein
LERRYRFLGPDTILVVPGPPIPTTGPINGTDTIYYLSSYEIYDVPSGANYNYLWSSVAPITTGQITNTITVNFSTFLGEFIPGAIQVIPEANGCIGLPVTIDLFILNILPKIDLRIVCEYHEFITLNVNLVGGILSGIGIAGNTLSSRFISNRK